MIGKTLYWAHIKDGEVEIIPHTILKQVNSNEHGVYYRLKGKQYSRCYTYEVGATMFLTKKEAVDSLIRQLEHSVDMGEKYLKKTKQQLIDTKEISRGIKN
jgi:hypothetical protein